MTVEIIPVTPEEVLGRCADLELHVIELQHRIEQLEKANPEATMPEECRQHTCSYYTHYLAYGPADLTHEGFHAAEKHCKAAQQAVFDWMDTHPEGDVPGYLTRIAEGWEKRVRA